MAKHPWARSIQRYLQACNSCRATRKKKFESTVRYLGVEEYDPLEIVEQTEI